MAAPQTGIFAVGTASHAYLELDARHGADSGELIQSVASLREPRTTIGGVNLVAGFRPELWASLAPRFCLPGLTGFNEPIFGAAGYTLPATQHDVVIWLTGAEPSSSASAAIANGWTPCSRAWSGAARAPLTD